MADLRLNIEQVRQDGLPAVCAACGQPATEYRRRWFIWTPGRNIPFALLGTWRYHRVTLEVPFCSADRSYFARRWVPLFVIGLLAIVGAVAAYIATDITRGTAQARALEKILKPAVAGVLGVLFVVGHFVKRRSIRIVEVEGNEFTLAGVSNEFVVACARGQPRRN